MYSEQIEELINAILEDGEISEKERKVLHKRALAEGIDPDEVDVIIDARLARLKKQQQSEPMSAPSLPPASNPSSAVASNPTHKVNHGVIRKCPSCGAQIYDVSTKCSDCGYVFTEIKANSSRERLNQILDQIDESHANDSTWAKLLDMTVYEEKRNAIINFPVPISKEDLLEFILFLQPLSKGNFFTSTSLTSAYKMKYRECVNKARVFYSDDPHFKKALGLDS